MLPCSTNAAGFWGRHSVISEADAVVVGAGALGLSTAFHLARLGVRRVALVDRFALASQTSPRAAGLFKLVQEIGRAHV